MRILQIAPAWIDIPPKGYGGTEWVIYNLTAGLSNLGHEVTVFATKKSRVEGELKYLFKKSFQEQNIHWSSALPAFLHYFEAFKLASEFDIVHAHLSSATDTLIMPFLASLSDQGVPGVMTVHGHLPYDRYSQMDKYFLDLYAKKIVAVSISQAMEKYMPKAFQRGGYVHNSLMTETLTFGKGGKYLTWVGKIVPVKGTREAILAAKAAGEQLIFGGVVDPHQEASVEYWEKHIKPLVDGDQIKFLGPLDLKQKNKLMGGAKAFLNPIDWEEPFGMVMVESMACGTPVISFDRGAASEIIIDGKTGFLVNTLDEMIQAISKVETISRLNCRRHIEHNFTPTVAATKYLQIYNKQISKFTAPKTYKNGINSKLIPEIAMTDRLSI